MNQYFKFTNYNETTKSQLLLPEDGTIVPDTIGRPDSLLFDISNTGAELRFLISDPTSREREQIKEGQPLHIKATEFKDCLFMLFKFGDLPWADAPYNVHLSPRLTRFPESFPEGKGLPLTMLFYDTTTGEQLCSRRIELNTSVSKQVLNAIKNQMVKPFSKTEYDNRLASLFAQNTTNQLVKIAPYGFRIR